jgi:Spy/CpxP family protein refolding chaperone
VLTALGVALFALGGCFESSTDVNGVQTSTSDNLVPTMEQIRAEVSMNDAQAGELQARLKGWESAERAISTTQPEQLLSPALEFVASAAEILERPQLTALVHVVVEHHQAHRADGPPRVTGRQGRRGGFGGPRGGFGGPRDGSGPFADLGLSEEQRQALREARREMGQAIRALRAQVRNGELTQEQFREAAGAAHEQFQASVQEILTPEQLALLQEKMKERMVERLERQVERHGEQSARRLELLTRILGLDDAQVQAIGAIQAEAGARLAALLAGLKEDTLTPEDARTALRDRRKSTHDAIVNELTTEQAELFEQLRGLHPRGRRHGPRG